MSKRKPHVQKQSDYSHIEWLKHRTGYPTPDEREKIIKRRQELLMELAMLIVTGVKPDDPKVRGLAGKYGAEEVERAAKIIGERLTFPLPIADDSKSYREYRQRYARFGAGLNFYTAKEIEELQKEHLKSISETDDINQESELDKLLLHGWRDWEDITPPAIPLPPADFTAPQPAAYPAPINELLEWGDNLDRSHAFVDEADFQHWKKHIPTLTRMALDPGLLKGWITDKASWAPWHAIHALGELQAWESAPALAKLADLENDWLSDHLPHIWAGMGMEVEPSLWMILENPAASVKQRGLAAQSLTMMAEDEDSDVIMNKVINGFEKILGNIKTFDPSVNAYLIHFLREMDAVDDVWETIEQAFDEDRVDTDIIDIDGLDDDYDDWDEDDFEDDFDDFDDDDE